jgi:competence ComEA-like helix-hairpin-helix protein
MAMINFTREERMAIILVLAALWVGWLVKCLVIVYPGTETLYQGEKLESKPLLINLNTATYKDLVRVPGIGNGTASSIISYRYAHGSFHDVEELLEIKGIGEKKLSRIRKFLYINNEPPAQ